MNFVMPDPKVLDWLGVDSDGLPNYLHLLNLMWSAEGEAHDLRLCKEVAVRLSHEPAYLREMLRSRTWRYPLVGSISVILMKTADFTVDLAFALKNINFVAPQIGVAMGLTDPAGCVPYLEELLGTAHLRADSKTIITAEQVLLRLGSDVAHDFSTTKLATHHRNDYDGKTAMAVVERHWSFWSEVKLQ
jgi:hypothetical protein